MEEFFEVSWFCDDEVANNNNNNNFVVKQSAFVSFGSKQNEGFGVFGCGNVSTNHRNMNKRVVEFLKTSWSFKNGQVKIEREKVHKHMIKERIRREKQKQSYLNLHKLLPMGTKSEKNAIVQTAARRIEELQKYKENLEKRNDEVQMILAQSDQKEEEFGKTKIEAKVSYPICGVDSMLEVLKCLKNCGTKAISIQSNFSYQEFSTTIEIETKSGAAEIEKAVQNTLVEAEWKFRTHW